MNFCPQATVKELVDNYSYIQKPKWEAFVGTDGEDYVNVKGEFIYDDVDMEADILLQFKVDTNNNTFQANSLEIMGITQFDYMMYETLQDMCNEAS